jgi:hypothetical protein
VFEAVIEFAHPTGFDSILAKFEEHAVVPVEFNLVERFKDCVRRSRRGKRSGDLLSPGIADLLAALERADPRSPASRPAENHGPAPS